MKNLLTCSSFGSKCPLMTNNFDPAEYNEDYENGYVDNQNFSPLIIKDIISKEQSDQIYKEVEKVKNKYIDQNFVGHRAWSFKSLELEKYLNEHVSKIIGEEMVLKEYSFARYSRKFGYEPKLFPHYDTHDKDGQRITVDIQLNSTFPWAVIVEGMYYYFNNNDALIFSGTQQIHWRENKTLTDDDCVDMLFAHFAYAKQKPWSKNQKEILEYWSHRLVQSTGISNQPIKI